jgi:hypothetical protein
MGYTSAFAERMNLAAAHPANDLASSGYCLADPGREYLVYLPTRLYPQDSAPKRLIKEWLIGGLVNVDLAVASGTVDVEWFTPTTGETMATGTITGGGPRKFHAPFPGDAVLYLRESDQTTLR